MIPRLMVLMLAFGLLGCNGELSTKQIGQTIETGQQVLKNEKLKNAGSEVFEGGKGLFVTGKDAAVSIGSDAKKVFVGGKTIWEETQQIWTDLEAQEDPNEVPETEEAVWFRVLTEGCAEGETQCFAWKETATDAWKLVPGEVKNLETLPDQLQSWQVQLEILPELLSTWKIGEVLTPEATTDEAN